jgi:tetratricopeptide (TPR) repeat protein
MTMELLKGDPLDSLIKLEAPFSKETAFRYFTELCAGLDYAHKRGLIHSDFKPANIFVTTSGVVKILDFGIARAANKDSQSSDFDAGDLGGLTPAYATVEMVNREAPSFSDDVYALACVFYQMLTGHHPYERLSAADAQAKKLKAKRPEVLSNKEWQALNQGLSFSKAKRPATIEAFRASLIPDKRSPLVKIVVGVLLVVIAGGAWLGIQQYQKDRSRERVIDDRLQAAKECFYQQSYQCAIENARVVTNLAPANSEAQELLKGAQQALQKSERQSRISRLLQDSRGCLAEGDYGCARVKVREILEMDPGEAQALQLVEKIEQESHKQNIGSYLAKANACLDLGDVGCATQALEEAKTMGAEPAELYEVTKRADKLAESQLQAVRQQEQTVQATIQEGQNCFSAKNYDCAYTKADEVLAMDSGNAEAIAMQQSIKLAKAQQIANEKTVASFLREAQDCYQKRNYSCAIAKSESALAIVPDSAAARSMKGKAESAQAKAKMSISIE